MSTNTHTLILSYPAKGTPHKQHPAYRLSGPLCNDTKKVQRAINDTNMLEAMYQTDGNRGGCLLTISDGDIEEIKIRFLHRLDLLSKPTMDLAETLDYIESPA